MNFLEDILQSLVNNKIYLKKIFEFDEKKLFNFYIETGIKSQDLLVVLEELLINSQEHGKTNVDFYYDKKINYFTFVIIDHGEGIHNTVPHNVRLQDIKGKSSSSILRISLEEGITGTGVIGRGMGLYYLSKFIKEKNATCLLASNSGMVIQDGSVFFEKALKSDIKMNCIIIQVHESELGL